MRAYRDPTSDKAVSKADIEWRQMASIAYRIRNNKCSEEWAEKQIPRFTGIFKRLLTDSVEELKRATHK